MEIIVTIIIRVLLNYHVHTHTYYIDYVIPTYDMKLFTSIEKLPCSVCSKWMGRGPV